MERPAARIATLDGWRAVAIGLVVWHHGAMSLYPVESAYWNQSLTTWGAFGVDIFFAISGLLITTLLLREASEGEVSLRAFYIRRGFRILPPLFVYLAVVTVAGRAHTGWDLASSVLLFRNYLPQSLGSHATGHLWSLSVEEHFYLWWPALLVLLAYRKGPRLVAYLAIAAGLWRITDVANGITATLFAELPRHFRTDLRLDALLWGCFVAFLLHDASMRGWLQQKLSRGWFAGMAAAAIASVVFYSYLMGLWLPMLLPLLLAATLLHPQWAVSRMLDWAPMRFVGRISYSLYLWQQLFLVPGWDPHAGAWVRFPMGLLLAVGCATLSYYLVEKPCIAFGRRLAQAQDRAAGSAEPVPLLP